MEFKTQRETRTFIDATDQHGRPWGYKAEKKTMHPTCTMNTIGWTDPLETPQKYITVPVGRSGRPKYGELAVEWDRWIADQREAERQRWNTAYQIAIDLFGNAVGDRDWQHDPKVVKESGPPPWPSVEALEAARDGLLSLLGYDRATGQRVPLDAKGAQLVRRFVMPTFANQTRTVGADPSAITYKEFLADAMRGGQTMSAAAVAWKEHRANLEAVGV